MSRAAATCCAAFSAPMEKHHQGAHLRCRDRRGGAAVAPLHPGAAIARQGGEPARYRLRARRDQPERDAGDDRGCPRRDRGAREARKRRSSADSDLGVDGERADRRDRRRGREAQAEARRAGGRMGDRAEAGRRNPQPARNPAPPKDKAKGKPDAGAEAPLAPDAPRAPRQRRMLRRRQISRRRASRSARNSTCWKRATRKSG